MYNSLQVEVQKRYSHGLTILGNYTFSNNTAQQGCRYLADCALDYYSPGTTHAMALAVRYTLPDPPGPQWLSKRILGSWIVGATGNASTGGYGSVGDYNCAQFNFNSAGCYANYEGGGALLSNRKTPVSSGNSEIGVSWLDPSKFVRADQVIVNGTVGTIPGQGQRLFLGDATIGVFKGPASGIEYFNASLDKEFLLIKTLRLGFQLEAFNALNHTVLNSPNYNNTVGPNTQGFGIISSANAPRSVQLSLHFKF
jgi:hypothetical protein